jgi:hypothetical protein
MPDGATLLGKLIATPDLNFGGVEFYKPAVGMQLLLVVGLMREGGRKVLSGYSAIQLLMHSTLQDACTQQHVA